MVVLNPLLIALVFIIGVPLAIPFLIAFVERFYSAYCNWVWDKLGV